MMKLHLLNSLMLVGCMSMGINTGCAETAKHESLSSQDDIKIVESIKALNDRLKASGKKSLEEYFNIINQENHTDQNTENSKIQHEVPDIIDPNKFIPISSLDFSNGDPYEKLQLADKEYYHFAKDQDIKELLRNFCATQGLNVIISDQIDDVVNGKFSNITYKQFWKDIVNAYGLTWFYDGGMLYVYKNSEIESKVIRMSSAEMYTLAKVMLQLNYICSSFSFRPLEKNGILVVSGPPKLMELIDELSEKVVIERVSDYYAIKSFPLKHAWAYDMQIHYKSGNLTVPGVATMLQQIVFGMPGALGQDNVALNLSNPKKAIPQQSLSDTNNKSNKENSNTDSDARSKGASKQDPVSLQDIFITYDTRLNAVIVKAKPQDMEFIGNIIEQLDVARTALRIDMAMVDISKAGALKIGNKLDVNRHRQKNSKEMRKSSFQQDFSQSNASPAVSLTRLLKGYSFEAVLNILEDVGDAQTLTRSSVITLDNIAAVIDKSSTQYITVTGTESTGLYDVSVSTKLVVVPHIIPDEFNDYGVPKIKMLIEVTDGAWSQSPLKDASAPTTDTQVVNTEASIYDGQNLFIGGHYHELHKKSEQGVPVLRSIPILGSLFKQSDKSTSVTERIYIISPSIVTTQDEDSKTYDRFFTNSKLSGQATIDSDEFNLTSEYNAPDFEIKKEQTQEEINQKRQQARELRQNKQEKKALKELELKILHEKRLARDAEQARINQQKKEEQEILKQEKAAERERIKAEKESQRKLKEQQRKESEEKRRLARLQQKRDLQKKSEDKHVSSINVKTSSKSTSNTRKSKSHSSRTNHNKQVQSDAEKLQAAKNKAEEQRINAQKKLEQAAENKKIKDNMLLEKIKKARLQKVKENN